jgi:hypothetical protein
MTSRRVDESASLRALIDLFTGYLGLLGLIRSLCLSVEVVPSGFLVRVVVVRSRTPSSRYSSLTSSKILDFFLVGPFVAFRRNMIRRGDLGHGKLSVVPEDGLLPRGDTGGDNTEGVTTEEGIPSFCGCWCFPPRTNRRFCEVFDGDDGWPLRLSLFRMP